MPWKTDDDGVIVVQESEPVWIYESGDNKGKEAPVNFGKTLASINKITAESIDRKNKLKENGEILQPLKDAEIEDVGAFITDAKKAMETVANLSDKDILDAGEVDKIKAQAKEVWERKVENLTNSHTARLTEKDATLQAKDDSIRNLIVRGAFDRSTFLQEETLLPSEFAYAQLGNRFLVEEVNGDLKGFGLDEEGNKLMSAKNPAEYADPEEAIELLIMSHPQRDRILKMDASGSGASESGSVKSSDLLAQYRAAKKEGNHARMVSLKRRLHQSGYKGIL